MSATEIFDVRTTTRIETIDITSLVRAAIRKSGVDTGLACIFCPHTTAGLTIQENSDPKVKTDLITHLGKVVPARRHATSAPRPTPTRTSRAACVGASLTLIIDAGKPVLGTWQALYFCEFDGPRSRRVMVKVVAG